MSPAGTGPNLVIGMHRSGTSLVARVMDQLGVFMGTWQESNAEARLFLFLNGLILRKCGGRWDHPEPIEHLLADSERRHSFGSALNGFLESPFRALFLGPGRAVRIRSLRSHPGPWGWKDPRNTFTAPLWLDVFDQARLICVKRHGVDVAASLRARSRAHWKRTTRLGSSTLFVAGAAAGPFARSSPVDTLAGGFDLWEKYLDASTVLMTTLPPDRFHQIEYEQLLSAPHDHIARLSKFVGLEPDDKLIDRLASDIQERRAFAYRSDPELSAFAASVAPSLEARGYSA